MGGPKKKPAYYTKRRQAKAGLGFGKITSFAAFQSHSSTETVSMATQNTL